MKTWVKQLPTFTYTVSTMSEVIYTHILHDTTCTPASKPELVAGMVIQSCLATNHVVRQHLMVMIKRTMKRMLIQLIMGWIAAASWGEMKAHDITYKNSA